MVTNGGGGYSRFDGMDVTRWRADGTLDNSGQWCYIKDVTPPSCRLRSPSAGPRVVGGATSRWPRALTGIGSLSRPIGRRFIGAMRTSRRGSR